MTEVLILAPAQSRRERLQRVLRQAPRIHVAGVATSFPFLRSMMDSTPANVVLIDAESLADSGSIHDWLMELLELIPAVVLGSAPDSVTVNRFLRADAGALLRGDASSEQIIHAINGVAAGLLTFDGALVLSNDAGNILAEKLTPRETEVLHLLAEGLVNREIATRLDISEHTIKFHIRSILGKLGASTRTEAVTLGLRSGLIEL
jgi:two-component system, NarL family, response regulator YdfI